MWLGIICVLFVIAIQRSVECGPSKIDEEVRKSLEKGGSANVIISFVQGIQPALQRTAALRLSRHGDWTKRNQAVVDAPRSNADNSQNGVLNILSIQTRGETGSFKYFKKYWSCNVVFIEQASADLIQSIAKDANMKEIKMEPEGLIPEVPDEDNSEMQKIRPTKKTEDEFRNWGLAHIEVPEAWKELGGNRGEGVIVGTIDTGVRHTHEALRDNFIGSAYGWFDPLGKTSEPVYLSDHGTNTLGILAGSKGIGVAPGAKWMTCLSCNKTHCPGRTLLDCMEFLSCPTLPDGTNPDCSKAPRVISNSWVSARGVTDYNDQILAWRAQGIIPVFAIGNYGVRCGKTRAPGELPWTIGVGGSDWQEWHWARGSVGPAADGGIKPDIVAPSLLVETSVDSADDAYETSSGTSMATPFVAGVIALLLVRQPEISYEEVYDIITSTAYAHVTLNPHNAQRYCNNGTSKNEIPKIYFGYGRLDALKSLQEQTKRLDKTNKLYFVVKS